MKRAKEGNEDGMKVGVCKVTEQETGRETEGWRWAWAHWENDRTQVGEVGTLGIVTFKEDARGSDCKHVDVLLEH